MFITKKKFAEEIEKAVRKREEEIWQHQRIDRAEESLHRRCDILEKRIFNLESKILGKSEEAPKKSCDCVPLAPL